MSWNINMMCDVMPTISEDAIDHPVNLGLADGDGLGGEEGGEDHSFCPPVPVPRLRCFWLLT